MFVVLAGEVMMVLRGELVGVVEISKKFDLLVVTDSGLTRHDDDKFEVFYVEYGLVAGHLD